jgi:hypothetical protein
LIQINDRRIPGKPGPAPPPHEAWRGVDLEEARLETPLISAGLSGQFWNFGRRTSAYAGSRQPR